MKFLKLLVFVFCLWFMLCGCKMCRTLYDGQRPNDYPNTRWVSKEPDIYFEVSDVPGQLCYGKLVKDGKTIDIKVDFSLDTDVYVMINDGVGTRTDENFLFKGYCKFSETKLVITIEGNPENYGNYYFGEDVKKITFIREELPDVVSDNE
ncbi:MAG: hypothetical protein PUB00_02495 [Clostridiales bacterium]|nr:hypothetical protein [Clostridiales bacterium]